MRNVRIGRSATGSPSLWRISVVGAAIATLFVLEIAALDRGYDFVDAVAGETPASWRAFNETLQVLAYVGLYAAAAFCLLAFARRNELLAEWAAAAQTHPWGRWLAAQAALFALLYAALPALQVGAASPPWLGFSAWLIGVAVMAGCAALALAPASFWRGLIVRERGNLLAALAAGALLYLAIALSRDSWHQLSAATLHTSYALLRFYESGAMMDPAERLLGADGFSVVIDAPCSGYEGVGLVLALLGFYMFAFRSELKFPAVLVLLPIGAGLIWLLNAVRLALLVSIGAHISRDTALNGFHSQAGWIFFLVVSISLMLVAHRLRIFRAGAAAPAGNGGDALQLAAALLIPFGALMAARLIAPAFGEGQYWITAALVALPTAALVFYRRLLISEFKRIDAMPVLIGLAVGAAWIATQPAPTAAGAIGDWLAQATPLEAAGWLALRVFGFALIVPIAEELAFRGYLHRALSARAFETAPPARFGWLAFIVTSAAFGALHERWLAGALAGAAFSLALYRSGSLSGAVAAHIAANAAIAAFAIAMQRWDLL